MECSTVEASQERCEDCELCAKFHHPVRQRPLADIFETGGNDYSERHFESYLDGSGKCMCGHSGKGHPGDMQWPPGAGCEMQQHGEEWVLLKDTEYRK